MNNIHTLSRAYFTPWVTNLLQGNVEKESWLKIFRTGIDIFGRDSDVLNMVIFCIDNSESNNIEFEFNEVFFIECNLREREIRPDYWEYLYYGVPIASISSIDTEGYELKMKSNQLLPFNSKIKAKQALIRSLTT